MWFEAAPTMSFRTLVPVRVTTDSLVPHIKLPTPVHCTSTTRYLSPVEAQDSPLQVLGDSIRVVYVGRDGVVCKRRGKWSGLYDG